MSVTLKAIILLTLPVLIITRSIEKSLNQDWDILSSHSLALSPLAKQIFSYYYKEEGELNVDKEICKVPHIYGFQNRTGIVPYTYAFNKLKSSTLHFLNQWHQHRHDKNLYFPPFPYNSCKLWMSHKYKFIYTAIPKTGFRSTKNYMIDVACNGTTTGCFEVLQNMDMTEEEYIKYFNTYFKFVFIRNPYIRAGSAYYMMSNPMKDDNGQKCIPPFHQHCQDPYKLKELCNKHFPYIKTQNKTGDCCCHVNNKIFQDFLDNHMSPQSPCIFDKNGQIMVDFIGRVGQYEEDLATILNELNKRNEEQIQVPEEVYHIGRFIELDSQNNMCKHVSEAYVDLFNENPQCLQPIRKYYYLDFKLLEFDSTD